MADQTINLEQQLYQLLCLLDLPDAAAKQGIELAPTSFRKPNAKGLELVLYRLYAVINGESRATKEFKNIWPVSDRNQAKEFNQKISDWFKELREGKHQLDSLSSTTASQLRSASGHRVVSTLLDLSTLALQQQYNRLAPQEASEYASKIPGITDKDGRGVNPLEHVVRDVAAVAVQQQVQRFLDLTQQAADLQASLEEGANDLCDQYYAARAAHQRAMAGVEGPVTSCPSLWQHYLDTMETSGAGIDSVQSQTNPPSLLLEPPQLPASTARLLPPLGSLDTHLAQYGPLSQLLASTVTSAVHPHAVDGVQLGTLAAGRPETRADEAVVVPGTTPSGQLPVVDVVDVVGNWVENLEDIAGALGVLVGDGARSSGSGRGSQPHPLLAPMFDSSGHAALLATQLRAHQAAKGQLQDMLGQLRVRLLEADASLHQLKPRISAAMHRVQGEHGPALLPSNSPAPVSKLLSASHGRLSYSSRRSSMGVGLWPASANVTSISPRMSNGALDRGPIGARASMGGPRVSSGYGVSPRLHSGSAGGIGSVGLRTPRWRGQSMSGLPQGSGLQPVSMSMGISPAGGVVGSTHPMMLSPSGVGRSPIRRPGNDWGMGQPMMISPSPRGAGRDEGVTASERPSMAGNPWGHSLPGFTPSPMQQPLSGVMEVDMDQGGQLGTGLGRVSGDGGRRLLSDLML